MQGEAWQDSRAFLRPLFIRQQVSDLELEERHLQDVFGRLKTNQGGWTGEVDLQPLFFNLTLDVATDFLFGYCVQSQNPAARSQLPVIKGLENPNLAKFGPSLDFGAPWLYNRLFLGHWYWLALSPEFYRTAAGT